MRSLTKDADGRPYARLPELRAGDVLEADDGFPCIRPGARLVVQADVAGRLYVVCFGLRGVPGSEHFDGSEPDEIGPHYLDGQADDGVYLIGLYRVDV